MIRKTFVLVVMLMSVVAQSATISNVRAITRGRTGMVDIYYDLYASEGGRVTVSASLAGNCDGLNISTLSGAVGSVTPGKNRCIRWNAYADNLGKRIDGARVAISATIMDRDPEPGLSHCTCAECLEYYPICTRGYFTFNGESYGDFYYDTQPVSYALWNKVYKWAIKHGYKFSHTYSDNTSASAIQVYPQDAYYWCNARSEMEGLPPCHYSDGAPSFISRSCNYGSPTFCYKDKGGYYMPHAYQIAYLISKGVGKSEKNILYSSVDATPISFGYAYIYDDKKYRALEMYYYTLEYLYGTGAGPAYLVCARRSTDTHPAVETIPRHVSNAFSVDYSEKENNLPIVGDFRIDNISSIYCSGEYGCGNKATFLSGVPLGVDFKAEVSGEEAAYFIIGEDKVNANEFTVAVGDLRPGDFVDVRAVSKSGRYSPPYRLNFDIASQPGFHIIPYRVTRYGSNYVLYGSGEMSTLDLFDGLGGLSKSLNVSKNASVSASVSFALAIEFDRIIDSRDGKSVFELAGGVGGIKDIGKFGDSTIYCEIVYSPTAHWNPVKLRWEEQSKPFRLKVGAEGSWTKYIVPLPIYARIGVSGDCAFKAEKLENGGLRCNLDGDIFALHGRIGCGAPGLLDVNGYVDGGLHLTLEGPLAPLVEECYCFCNAGARYVFAGKTFPIAETGRYIFWFVPDKEPESSGDVMKLVEPDPVDVAKAQGESSSREYLTGGKNGTLQTPYVPGENNVVTGYLSNIDYGYATTIQPNGAPYSNPEINGCDVYAEWDDPLRDANNKFVLTYSEKIDDTKWRVGKKVWDDGTSDHHPSAVKTKTGERFVAWMNSKSLVGEGATIGEQMQDMEIAVATHNESTGEWVAKNLTNDDAFDHSPVLVANGEDSAAVAWIRNEYANYLGSVDEPNTIMYSDCVNGEWSSPQVLVANVGKMRGISFASANTQEIIAYTEVDDDIASVKVVDRVDDEWSEPIVIDSYQDCGGVPRVYCAANGNAVVVWNKNGEINFAEIVSNGDIIKSVLDSEDESIPIDFELATSDNGSLAIVWLAPSIDNPKIMNPMMMLYNPEIGKWSSAVRLVNSSVTTTVNKISADFDVNDALQIAYTDSSLVADEEGDERIESASIKVLTRRHSADVMVVPESAQISEKPLESGESAHLKFTVKNVGDMVAEDVKISVRDWGSSPSVTIFESEILSLDVREDAKFDVIWTPTNGMTKVEFDLMASASNDVYSYNNRQNVRMTDVRLSISCASVAVNGDGTCDVSATVRNDLFGQIPSGTVVMFRDGSEDGAILGSNIVGRVCIGESGGCDVGCKVPMSSLSMDDGFAKVYVTAELPASVAANGNAPVSSIAFVSDNAVGGNRMSLVLNDGVGGSEQVESYKANEEFVLPKATISRAGYKLQGWKTDPNGEQLYGVNDSVYNPPMYSKDTSILYAVWEKMKSAIKIIVR